MTQSKHKIQLPDGSSTCIQLFESKQAEAVCILFPAMGVYAKYYEPLAEELYTEGITTVLADLRGNDTSSVRPSKNTDFGYSKVIELDYKEVISFVKKEFSELPLYLFGHSLGGQLSCLYAAKNPNEINGLILSATCSVYFKGWKGVGRFRTLLGTQLANLVAKALGYFPGKKLGFGGIEAKTLIRDWSYQSRTGEYNLHNDAFNYELALSQLSIPVLAISFENDHLSPTTAVEHLLGKMTIASKEHHYIENSFGEKFNHFNWAKKPETVVRIVTTWLKKNS